MNCEACRDCGVFPGDTYGEWSFCICGVGQIWCEQNEIELQREVDAKHAAIVAALENLELESGTFALLRGGLAVLAEDDFRDLDEITHLELSPARRARRSHEAN